VTGGGSWRTDNGTRIPWIISGEVGKQYLFVFGYSNHPSTDAYQWFQEGALAAPVVSGRMPVSINSDKPFFKAIQGKSPGELSTLFATPNTSDG
jgi:hypothetical protein